jgi:flagellar biosynthesis protein FlhB
VSGALSAALQAMLIAGVAAPVGAWLWGRAGGLLRSGLSLEAGGAVDSGGAAGAFLLAGAGVMVLCGGFGLVARAVQGGVLWRWERVLPDAGRLDPVRRLRGIGSPGWTLWSMVMGVVVGGVGAALFASRLESLARTTTIAGAARDVAVVGGWTLGAAVVAGCVDCFLRRRSLQRALAKGDDQDRERDGAHPSVRGAMRMIAARRRSGVHRA